MRYRSLSCQEAWPDSALVRLGSDLGFNDVCFQTEGGTLGPLVDLRGRADANGYFELLDERGMTSSLWVHEFADTVQSWGSIDVENERLWDGIERRYEYVLGELFPELDHLILTVAETERWVTDDRRLLQHLVAEMNDRCREFDTRLVLRSFVHESERLAVIADAIERLPEDVWVMTKCVPQDWNYRSIDHPLLGNVGDRREIVEIDIAGEYYRMDHVANAFVEKIVDRFDRWVEAGCDGVSVRVDRGWVPWQYQNTVLGEAQEANLWALGYLSAGRTNDPEAIWEAFATERFGPEVADEMIDVLRPTGRVVEEGLHVDRLTFGNTKPGQAIPAIRSMEKDDTARTYDDDEAERQLWCDPFNQRWSPWRWDESYRDEYHEIRTGNRAAIAEKERAYEEALDLADESLMRLARVESDLPDGCFRFFRFKLEENRFHLRAMCEAELAWLMASNRLYRGEASIESVRRHLEALRELADRSDASVECSWLGETHHLSRGEYVDIPGFLESFQRYWNDVFG